MWVEVPARLVDPVALVLAAWFVAQLEESVSPGVDWLVLLHAAKTTEPVINKATCFDFFTKRLARRTAHPPNASPGVCC